MLIRVVSVVFLIWLSITGSRADERILSFHSDIVVNADSTLNITETITVRAEAQNIKRGIYRDFPTKYKDDHGNNYSVSFDVESVLRDGVEEQYFTT